jgi:hypothetical protein
MVTFIPEAVDGKPAQALTRDDGTFRLSTQKEDGALPGDYRVVITKADEETIGRYKGQIARGKMPSLLPEMYSTESRTPLKCTVPHPGEIKFNLDSRAKR